MNRLDRIELFRKIDLYPVTCQPLSAGRTSLEILDGILAGGAKIVQLREKEMPMAALYPLAVEFRRRTAEAGALLIINDHIDLALAIDADGVHLGQSDFPLEPARRIAPELILGRSSHNLAQAMEAQAQGADYVNVGPIFPTGTKPEHKVFLGPEAIGLYAPSLQIPFTVMGGINANNIDSVVSAGAKHIAVVTAITKAANVKQAVLDLRGRINKN